MTGHFAFTDIFKHQIIPDQKHQCLQGSLSRVQQAKGLKTLTFQDSVNVNEAINQQFYQQPGANFVN
jgi:hypothetical protein